MSISFPRKTPSKLSLTSARSEPSIAPRVNAQESQQQLETMHRIVDQTEYDLRHALEHAAHRRDQLDELHVRSAEMLNKNESLVFGITNYRKTQERGLFWQRFRYTAFGALTIGIIILIIILGIASKRPSSSPQVIDLRQVNEAIATRDHEDTTSRTTVLLASLQRRKKRKIVNDIIVQKPNDVFRL